VCKGRQGRAHGGGQQVERGKMSDDGLNLWWETEVGRKRDTWQVMRGW
jgi:hypothetical protein